MSAAVIFDNVFHAGVLNGFSCAIDAGATALILTSREEDSLLLIRLISGMVSPDSGSITILGVPLRGSDQESVLQLRKKIGIVPFQGGLISNLKMWENILLPCTYHAGKHEVSAEEMANNYMDQLNYTGSKMALPAHLTLYEKRAAAFTRAALMKPEIMLYCNSFEKISPAEQASFSSVTTKFHRNNDRLTSIYFAPTTHIPVKEHLDMVVSITPQIVEETVA